MNKTCPIKNKKPEGFSTRYIKEVKKILSLAWPLIITQLGMTAIGFIDTMMAGHYSKTALAGAAIGSSIAIPCIIALSGITMAVTPITAYLKGRREEEKYPAVIRNSIWVSIAFAILIIIIINLSKYTLGFMGISKDVAITANKYLTGISIGIPAVAIYGVLRSFIEGLGDTRPQMYISIVSVFFNYFVNDILIYGKLGLPELGGAGCGFASGLTLWLFLILILIYINSKEGLQRIKRDFHFTLPDTEGIKEILFLGFPIGASLFMECSIFACITLFIGKLGPDIVGGHQITLNYSGVVFAIPMSIGMAITITTGHALGRGNPKEARFSAFTGISSAVCFAFFTLIATYQFAEDIASFYTNSPEVANVAVLLLKTAALYQISDAVMVSSQGALRGYKDTKMIFILTFTAYWVITLPLGYTISMTDAVLPKLGAKGFWISLIFGLSTSGIFLISRLNQISKRV